MKKQAIGVFDSGIGGLTILRALRKELPHENLIYFGDSANVPYGNKSKQAVVRLALRIAKFLESRRVKLIVVACNTVSAQALPVLRKHIKTPIMGVIEPGAASAVNATQNHRIAVLGTQGTVQSKAYVKSIKKLNKHVTVFQQACPLFVPLAEEGFAAKPAAALIAREYLAPIKQHKADTVILGCTHYPILKNLIGSILGPRVTLVDSADTLTQAAKLFLQTHAMAAAKGTGTLTLYASDDPAKFTKSARQLLGANTPKAILKKLNS